VVPSNNNINYRFDNKICSSKVFGVFAFYDFNFTLTKTFLTRNSRVKYYYEFLAEFVRSTYGVVISVLRIFIKFLSGWEGDYFENITPCLRYEFGYLRIINLILAVVWFEYNRFTVLTFRTILLRTSVRPSFRIKKIKTKRRNISAINVVGTFFVLNTSKRPFSEMKPKLGFLS